ncbi:MAG: M23 family metallopeptidase, partial [Actinomycetota bacterium]|nr:M23 family metallopeptidase [Actinomycetota bacterium]
VTRGGGGSRWTRPAFAEVDGLALHLPHPRPVAVAFHEAGRAEALALAPVGRLVANDNPRSFVPGPDSDGPGYRILSSRGRARPPTSAVDVVVGAGDWVGAPVSGRVVEVREYALYGSQRDWRVVIEPAERPDLHLVLVHLYEPVVEVADRLRAGERLAKARLLPLRSQVDSVTGRRLPHVHIEARAATEVDLVDPNEPALPADAALDGA